MLRFGLGIVVAAGFVSGCFTSPINMRPYISIKAPPGGIYHRQSATFTATVVDPDGDNRKPDWQWTRDVCPPDSNNPASWPLQGDPQSAFVFVVPQQATDERAFCVWARVVDSAGAVAVDTLTVATENHAPKPAITPDLGNAPANATTGFPLHSMITLRADATRDDDVGDVLHFKWRLAIGNEGAKDLPSCTPADDKVVCIPVQVPQVHRVTLTVKDDFGGEASTDFVFAVAGGSPPVAFIDLVKTSAPPKVLPSGVLYRLGTTFRFTSVRSFDNDSDPAKLDRKFEVVLKGDAPMTSDPMSGNSVGMAATLEDCADEPGPVVQCFTAHYPGKYAVRLTVTSDGQSATDDWEGTVLTDQPPCIAETSPSWQASDNRSICTQDPLDDCVFRVISVDDDLKPFGPQYPATTKAPPFDWFVILPDGSTVPGKLNFQSFSVKSWYRAGEEVGVRLQIRDPDDEMNQFACDDKKDTCSATNDQCLQRFTWHVKFQ